MKTEVKFKHGFASRFLLCYDKMIVKYSFLRFAKYLSDNRYLSIRDHRVILTRRTANDFISSSALDLRLIGRF